VTSSQAQASPNQTPQVTASPDWVRKPVARGPAIRLVVDGVTVTAFEGESVGVALAAAGRLVLRHSPGLGAPRGMFCLMGVCQECAVDIDGAMLPSCMTPARDGMRVTTDALTRRRDAGSPRKTAE